MKILDSVIGFFAPQVQDAVSGAELVLLMGTDMFLSFHDWKYPERILQHAILAVLDRGGKNAEEKLEKLIAAINELKARVGIKETIKDYGIDEKVFLDNLDEMVEQAFDDQCTGANPRYPLMSEIKQMYLNAYYGKHENI